MKKLIFSVLVLVGILLFSSPVSVFAQTSTIQQLQVRLIELQKLFLQQLNLQQQNTSNTQSLIPNQIQTSTTSIERLFQIERADIVNSKMLIRRSGGHDYSSMYRLISNERGSLEKITRLCDNFDPIFCYKKASAQNPGLRDGLCNVMSGKIENQYKSRVSLSRIRTLVNLHKKDCLLGVPQLSR